MDKLAKALIVLAILVPINVAAQIKVKPSAPEAAPPPTEQKQFDPRYNYPKKSWGELIGQNVFVISKSAGYYSFYRKPTSRSKKYKTGSAFTPAKHLENRYFTITAVVESDAKYEKFLELRDKETDEAIFYKVIGPPLGATEWEFVIVSHYEYLEGLIGTKSIWRYWSQRDSDLEFNEANASVTLKEVYVNEEKSELYVTYETAQGEKKNVKASAYLNPLTFMSLDLYGSLLETVGDERGNLIAKRQVFVGMTEDELVIALGYPAKKNQTTTAGDIREQWVYPGLFRTSKSKYVYLENGVVTAIQ